MLIEAVVEEVMAIAPSLIRRTEPRTPGKTAMGIRSPDRSMIREKAQLPGEGDIPARFTRTAIRGAVSGKESFVICRVEIRGEGPLSEMVLALDPADGLEPVL